VHPNLAENYEPAAQNDSMRTYGLTFSAFSETLNSLQTPPPHTRKGPFWEDSHHPGKWISGLE